MSVNTVFEAKGGKNDIYSRPFWDAIVPIRDFPNVSEYYAQEILNMGVRRRKEFLSGRQAAHRALVRAGADMHMSPVRKASTGAPIWPIGWKGSISHDRKRAVAIVCPADRSIGVDLEDLTSVNRSEAAAKLCFSERERKIFYKQRDVICAFSAKEAVFKAIADTNNKRIWLPAIQLSWHASDILQWWVPQTEQNGQVFCFADHRRVLSLCLI